MEKWRKIEKLECLLTAQYNQENYKTSKGFFHKCNVREESERKQHQYLIDIFFFFFSFCFRKGKQTSRLRARRDVPQKNPGRHLFVRKVCNKYSVVIFSLLQYAPTDYLAVKRKPL